MTDLQIDAGILFASADERLVTGLLVPYGENCKSNLGMFSVGPGVFTIPADVPGVVGFNVEHAREASVGRAISATETERGIVATFSVAKTPEGDAALADITSGKRKFLSAEVSGVIVKAGKAVAGSLFGGALVGKPAFPSATLLASLDDPAAPAAATEPTETVKVDESDYTDEAGVQHHKKTTTKTTVDGETTTVVITEVITEPQPEPKTEGAAPVGAATAPNTLTAAATTAPRGLSLAQMGTLYAQRASGLISDADFSDAIKDQNGSTMFAALSDIKYDGTGGVAPAQTAAPQWLGQVWQAAVYRQQVLPLFAHRDLTGLNFSGFKFGTKPAGGDWAGNKAAVPSNTITVTPITGTASRYAIGHDIAREFVDFPVEGFFEAYAAAVSEDYARWSDAKVAAAVLAGATALAADALTTLPGGTNNIGSAASAIIDGAVAVASTGTLPNFALVAPALYKSFIKNPTTNVIGYLNAALGLVEGSLEGFIIRPSASITAGKVLVGAREAVTVMELPGAPIRIDALDLARGGVDKAAFGYAAVNVNDSAALQLVTAATA